MLGAAVASAITSILALMQVPIQTWSQVVTWVSMTIALVTAGVIAEDMLRRKSE